MDSFLVLDPKLIGWMVGSLGGLERNPAGIGPVERPIDQAVERPSYRPVSRPAEREDTAENGAPWPNPVVFPR